MFKRYLIHFLAAHSLIVLATMFSRDLGPLNTTFISAGINHPYSLLGDCMNCTECRQWYKGYKHFQSPLLSDSNYYYIDLC